MALENGLQSVEQVDNSAELNQPAAATSPSRPPSANTAPSRSTARRVRWFAGAIGVFAVGGVVLFFSLRPGISRRAAASTSTEGNGIGGIPVNTIQPAQKTLMRTLEQPGSIKPQAQSELYAKTSGYVKFIQREISASAAAELVARSLTVYSFEDAGSPGVGAACLAAGLQHALGNAPQKDIGSVVRAGEVLMQLDVPEQVQDVAQKEALYLQAEAELKQARTAIGTFEASVTSAQAQKKQAEADIRRFASEHAFQALQLKRLEDLLKDRVGTQEVVDEKKNQVNAALAAWESSQAKAQASQADLKVVSSKLAAARDDVLVKEARVRVAREELRRAQIVADYASIRAPLDGVITFRAVDEGDFVQNSTSGQVRHVMTVAAVDKVKVVIQVPERDAPWVRVGAEATILMDARAGWHAKGYVSRTSQALDSQSRTMQAEIDLDNKDRRLLPGMYGQVVVTLQSIEKARSIPASAVFSRRGENYVLLVQDNIARRQRVRIRYDDGRELEVVKLVGEKEISLDGTEELIVSNKGEIADGQRVLATRLNSGGSATRGLAAP